MAVSFGNIRSWNGSQNEAFEELCCQLASFESFKGQFYRKRGSGGDAGVECYWKLPDSKETGWQAKYFFTIEETQWRQTDDSVKKALEKHPALVHYIICFPIDLADARVEGRRSQKEQWDNHVQKWQNWASIRGMEVEFELWGQHQLLERLSRPEPPYAGRAYFWFSQTELTFDWMKRSYEEVRANAGPRYTPETHVDLPEAWLFEGIGRTDIFYDRILNLYGQLARAWNKESRWFKDLCKEFPKLSRGVNDFGITIKALSQVLKDIDRESFANIGFVDIANLASQALDAGYNVRSVLWEIQSKEREKQEDSSKCEALERRINEFFYWLNRIIRPIDDIRVLVTSESCLAADSGVLLLSGSAGTGKTHLFCDITKKRLNNSLPTIFLLGQHFTDEEPWIQIIKLLHLDCNNKDEFLGALDSLAQAIGRRALILIDALNEGQGKFLWPKHINGILQVLKEYPSIGIALSCRTSYLDIIIPEGISRELLVRAEHHGFQNHEYIATNTFFDFYDIERPNVPLLVPEFSNPLFLKVFCKGLAALRMTRLPRGFTGITAVLELFIKSVNLTLSRPERLDYPERDNFVKRALEDLAQIMAESGDQWVEWNLAKSIIDEILPSSRGYSNSLFANLLYEGVIAEDIIYRWGKLGEDPKKIGVIRFPYERFTDQLIVRYLLGRFYDKTSPESSFASSNPLGEIVANLSKASMHSGLVEALCVQLPETTGKELVELATQAKGWESVQKAFLQSLIWRDTSKVTDATHDYLNEICKTRGLQDVYDVMLTIAVEPEHPYNAEALHKHLINQNIADRDTIWTIYINDTYEEMLAVDRLIDWAWDAEKAHFSDEPIELCAIVLSWFLTASNRFYRDRATKALVSMLTPRPHIVNKILDRFRDVDDPYVLERLYAVSYGVAIRSSDTGAIQQLASKVYSLVFKDGTPYPHILLRDYARGVIEVASHRGVLPDGVDLTLIKPPYKSKWPLEIPSDDELQKYCQKTEDMTDDDYARTYICSSVLNQDFGTYVVDSSLRYFTSRIIGSAKISNEDDPAKKLLQSYVKDLPQQKKEILEDLTFDKANTFIHFIEKEELPFIYQLFDAGAEKLLELLGDMTSKLEKDDVGMLRAFIDESQNYQQKIDQQNNFDTSVAKNWIVKRVFELGWDACRFGRYDYCLSRYGNHGREAHKRERIGKKYQWIAMYEFLAHVADNIIYKGWNNEEKEYVGPVQIRRDIDPSLTIRCKQEFLDYTGDTAWWHPVSRYYDTTNFAEQVKWITEKSDFPNPRELLQVLRLQDKTKWLTLEGHYHWQEQGPIEEERYDNPRRDMWVQVRSYIVRKEHTEALLIWLRDQHFMGRWMPEQGDMYEIFIGEYPWAPSYCEWKGEYEDWVKKREMPFPVVITTADYNWSNSGYDCSNETPISALLPSAWLINEMGLHWAGEHFTYKDNTNQVVVFDPSFDEAGHSAVLISKEKMVSFLEEKGYTLIWTVLGERMLIGGGSQYYGRMEYSAAYWLDGEDIMELMSKFIQDGFDKDDK